MYKNIGSVELINPWILAPLAGITDEAMRTLCEEQGAALTCTEMISAKGIYYGDKKTEILAHISEKTGPTAIQIFGSEPEIMKYAAEKLEQLKNVILDINMGCPVPKVVKNGDGSALLKNPDLIYKVVKATVSGTSKPVTVKIRKGFDENTVNAVEVAQAIESAGASAVTIHGRTREEYYSGKADWSIIKEVKKNVSIPVIGNGDVMTAEEGMRMLDETGCDFVMVARGAIGNPWIFRDLNLEFREVKGLSRPNKDEIVRMMTRHLDMICKNKGEKIAVKEFRKFVAWYTKGLTGAARLRQAVNFINEADKMKEVIKSEKWEDL